MNFISLWNDPSWQRGVILGAKETAKSLYFAAFALWSMIFWSYKLGRTVDVGFIAGSEDQAKIDLDYLTLRSDKGLAFNGRRTKEIVLKATEHGLTLKNGSEAWVYSASYYSAHGKHPLLVLGDEAVLASKPAGGQILEGVLQSIATGGRGVLASALYWNDKIFCDIWNNAPDRGYVRIGGIDGWLKHPYDQEGKPLSRRPWLTLDDQIRESKLAQMDPNSRYEVFWRNILEAGIGDVFPPAKVDELIEDYSLEPTAGAKKALGVDTGFGSSLFGITGIEERDGILHVILSEAEERPSFPEMAEQIANLYHLDGYYTIFVDASNPAFIRELNSKGCSVVPVPFQKELSDMLSSGRFLVERRPRQLLIDRGFPDLIWELKNAQFDSTGKKVDKTKSSTFDRLDSWLCALRMWTGLKTGRPAAVSG